MGAAEPPPGRSARRGSVTTASDSTAGFDPATLADLPEPVRRYFEHALAAGTPLSRGVRLRMHGHIKVGLWLRFDSVWEGDGRSISWRATSGPGRFAFLRVHDHFAEGAGFMDVRVRSPLTGRPGLKLIHAEDDDTARSGAGRAALEALWAPAALLPGSGVDWRADGNDRIVATWDVPPERPEVHITIDSDGAVRSYQAARWRSSKVGYLPFGADIHAERTFGGLTIPSEVTAGWGYGTPDWSPFFRAQVTEVQLVDEPARRRRAG